MHLEFVMCSSDKGISFFLYYSSDRFFYKIVYPVKMIINICSHILMHLYNYYQLLFINYIK